MDARHLFTQQKLPDAKFFLLDQSTAQQPRILVLLIYDIFIAPACYIP